MYQFLTGLSHVLNAAQVIQGQTLVFTMISGSSKVVISGLVPRCSSGPHRQAFLVLDMFAVDVFETLV